MEKEKQAIRCILEFIGDNPDREDLIKTPEKFLGSLKKFFSGYKFDFSSLKSDEIDNKHYRQMIIIDNIEFISFCEHHILPFKGKVKVAYLPDKHIIGIGKITKIIKAYSSRLQIQERLTFDIASMLAEIIQPKGVATLIEASHSCLYLPENTNYQQVELKTFHFIGCFEQDQLLQNQFLKG